MFRIHGDAVRRDNETEKTDFLNVEFALLEFDI